jgi:hypothetical protein
LGQIERFRGGSTEGDTEVGTRRERRQRQRGRARRSETEGGEKVRDTEMETETGREVEYTTSG